MIKEAYQSDRVSSRVVPIVVVSNDFRARETVAIHERTQGNTNLRLLRRRDLACRVCRVAIFRLILGEETYAISLL